MDFATRLLQWRQVAPEHWARAANRYLPPAVSALLIVAIGMIPVFVLQRLAAAHLKARAAA